MELKNISEKSISAHWKRVTVGHLDISVSPTRRRTPKVLYPPLVRRPRPRGEPSGAKRWLLALTAVLFLQIYTEEGPEGPQSSQMYAEDGWELLSGPQSCPEVGLNLPNGPETYTGKGPEGLDMRPSCWVFMDSEASLVQRLNQLPFQANGPVVWTPRKNSSDFVNSLL
ncbi:hypothetical protein Z043_104951 [Scleropages formosus]|uniref:Uncharacterized protein n=1 Tax=Scleropages formosus TaxID=113540 RepID=A0A0N8K1S7_SCLFO|nr:hypothetical protein Z043_104951 [Scleropages formosus]